MFNEGLYREKQAALTDSVDRLANTLETLDIEIVKETYLAVLDTYSQFVKSSDADYTNMDSLEVHGLFMQYLKIHYPVLRANIQMLDDLYYELTNFTTMPAGGIKAVKEQSAYPIQQIREVALEYAIKTSGPIEWVKLHRDPRKDLGFSLDNWLKDQIRPGMMDIFAILNDDDLLRLGVMNCIAKLVYQQQVTRYEEGYTQEQLFHRAKLIFEAEGLYTGYENLASTIKYPHRLREWAQEFATMTRLDLNQGVAFMDAALNENLEWSEIILNPEAEEGIFNWHQIVLEYNISLHPLHGRCPILPSLVLFLAKLDEYFYTNGITAEIQFPRLNS